MEQKEKELLLRDLSARLQYDVMCQIFDPSQEYEKDVFNARLVQIDGRNSECYFWGCGETDPYKIETVKPFLRLMLSMTEGEKKEFHHMASLKRNYLLDGNFYTHYQMIDWLNQHHFDYRGLISKGLALEAPDGMYK